MAIRTKPKQKKIMLSEEKAVALDKYLADNNLKLQDLLEGFIDTLLKK